MDRQIKVCKNCGKDYKIEEGYNDECCSNACATKYDGRFTTTKENPWHTVTMIACLACCG